jgi:ribonucleoside-diphosphate reductase alpha chain
MNKEGDNVKLDVGKPFRTGFSQDIFNNKYKHETAETWQELSSTLIDDVCDSRINAEDKKRLIELHSQMKFIAGGRYLYYAGRPHKFFNNCYLLKAEEDSREDWANLSWKSESALLTGGGIGTDYSIYRPAGTIIKKTGGLASGTVPKMKMINEIGRNVMQGGSRRSAIYASLNWQHGDIDEFLHVKDWGNIKVNGAYDENGNIATVKYLKEKDFDYPAPLDMTNISVNYNNAFLESVYGTDINDLKDLKIGTKYPIIKIPRIYIENVRQALSGGEPGFSFNFYESENETLRNACTEVTSEDDSDVCNLGSINMSRIDTIEEFKETVGLVAQFLLCGTLVAKLPYEKVYRVREKNRRLGVGLMGVHEWLLKRGYRYEVVPELKQWLEVYKNESKRSADELADKLGISRPIKYRAIAPTGTIGILAGTSTGLEPLFAVSYKRRYLKGKQWRHQFVIDGTSKLLIEKYGLDHNKIETALDLAKDPERRIKFQADVQDYVDMSISSTINIPAWGTEGNNENHVNMFARTLLNYAPRLRGFTVYPDGSRGGQPLTPVDYETAKRNEGQEFNEEFFDICELGKGGTCGV